MKEILNFVNNNAGVVSLITLMVTIVFQIIMTKSDRKYNEKQENKKNRRKEFENKAEFIIDNNMEDDGTIPHIEIFMTDFDAKVINNKTDVEFYYSKDILNKNMKKVHKVAQRLFVDEKISGDDFREIMNEVELDF